MGRITRHLTVSLCLLLAGTIAQAEEFFFPHVGMRVESADTWTINSGAEFAAQNRNASFGTEELDKLLRSDQDLPFFSMLSDMRMGTTVQAGFNVFAFDGQLPDLDQAAQNVEEFMLQSFRDAELVRPRTISTLGGQNAAKITLTYTLDLGGGVTHKIYEEVWLIPRVTNYVTLSYGSLVDDTDPQLWREIRQTLNSITWEDPS